MGQAFGLTKPCSSHPEYAPFQMDDRQPSIDAWHTMRHPLSFPSAGPSQVQPAELEKFHAQYGTLLKASMGSLRKRDKRKEKHKAEEAAKRKKRLAEPVLVDGPKRGAGRKKRMRKIKAALKQEETKKRIEEREAAKERAKNA